MVFFGSDVVDVLTNLFRDALLQFAILLKVLSGGLADALLCAAYLRQFLSQAGIHEVAMGFEVGKQLALSLS